MAYRVSETVKVNTERHVTQFVIFKPLSYCFQETVGFDVKASFVSRPVSGLID